MGNSSDPEAHGMTFCRVAQSRLVGLPWPWLKCLHDLSICLGSGVPCPSNSHIFGYDLKDYKDLQGRIPIFGAVLDLVHLVHLVS